MGTSAAPPKRYDLPRAIYPITLEARDPESGVLVWSKTIRLPFGAQPAYFPSVHYELSTRVHFGDGTVIGPRRYEPDPAAGEG